MVQMTDVPGFQLPKCEEFIDDPAVQDFRGVCPGFTPSFGEYIPHEFFGMGFIRISRTWKHHFN